MKHEQLQMPTNADNASASSSCRNRGTNIVSRVVSYLLLGSRGKGGSRADKGDKGSNVLHDLHFVRSRNMDPDKIMMAVVGRGGRRMATDVHRRPKAFHNIGVSGPVRAGTNTRRAAARRSNFKKMTFQFCAFEFVTRTHSQHPIFASGSTGFAVVHATLGKLVVLYVLLLVPNTATRMVPLHPT
jgi:hypothetical protein